MKVLLHICCAPCAVMCVKNLREEDFDVAGLWFNPSIHPYGEWKKRRSVVVQFAEAVDLPVIYEDKYLLNDNLKLLLEGFDKGKRCEFCYSERLEKTAKIAKKEGFSAFTTTLLYSKYQDHSAIISTAESAATKHGITFLYRDFRPLWGKGITESKKMGLYRQRWCGCIFSELEAEKDRENRKHT
ncbi:epoxyqueuosine reductase QueH [bacterium]|nr:epoxyqueuosine reductase QueH [bacterium]